MTVETARIHEHGKPSTLARCERGSGAIAVDPESLREVPVDAGRPSRELAHVGFERLADVRHHAV
jgi:hypothetical protein